MYRLIHTDDSCRIAGTNYAGLPLLVDGHGRFVVVVCDYLRYLAVERSHSITTVTQYADVLRMFWNYLGTIDWPEVDDQLLLEWRNGQDEDGVHRSTINARLRIVFQCLLWAQNTGAVSGMIAETVWDERGRREAPQILAVRPKSRQARSTGAALAPRMLYRSPGRARRLYTPTEAEISRVHTVLAATGSSFTTARNTLMASWAEEAGLRRKEFAALHIEQIPSYSLLYDLVHTDGLTHVELTTTKGGRVRTVPVAPELLIRTRDFIECERADLLARLYDRRRGIRTTPIVFISATTGAGLKNLRSISNLQRSAFRQANVPSWGHRLRARYLTNLTEAYLEEEYAKHGDKFDPAVILLKVAEAAGHKHIASLRVYLNLVLKRRFTKKGGDKTAELRARELAHRRLLVTRARRSQSSTEIEARLADIIGVEQAKSALRLIADHRM